MESFWDGVSGKEIHAAYSVCTPAHTNVLKNLQLMAEDQQEDKVSRWLTGYSIPLCHPQKGVWVLV